jgi:hypothetical protein
MVWRGRKSLRQQTEEEALADMTVFDLEPDWMASPEGRKKRDALKSFLLSGMPRGRPAQVRKDRN